VKYGYTHERARQEINKRVTELENGSFKEFGNKEEKH
jgi:hypothetical protein